MTSKEALNKLCDLATPNGECLNYVISLAATIKQDLEVLEWLKEDNKIQVELVGKLLNKNNQLEKENKELKEEIQDLKDNETIVADYGVDLWNENEKLKKVIEILAEKRVNIDYLLNSSECPTYNFYADDFSDLTQQEYDLLKEVLK